MCLILFAQNHHPEYKLVLAALRDEFYERPTLSAHKWKNGSGIIAGKDLRAGGTWLALDEQGRLAAVTNYRDLRAPRQVQRSRGQIVLDVLWSDDANKTIQELEGSLYDGFNLLFWNGTNMLHYSNISSQQTLVSDGVHGLSNHLLNTPWRKVERGKALLQEQLTKSGEELVEGLFGSLLDESEAQEADLPDTGLPPELEKKISAMFIQTEDYGTRCATVVLIGHDGSIHFEERSFVPQARALFKIDGKMH